MSICIMSVSTFYCIAASCGLAQGALVGIWLKECLVPKLTASQDGLNDDILARVIKYKEENNIHSNNEKICKEYETIFNDKDLLIKTLQEHGVTDLELRNDNIYCKIEEFKLKFFKDANMPYKFEITHCANVDIEETINNLDSEYAKNVQEATYLKIKERLAKNNLQIDDEEILEDDSIMLTINLD